MYRSSEFRASEGQEPISDAWSCERVRFRMRSRRWWSREEEEEEEEEASEAEWAVAKAAVKGVGWVVECWPWRDMGP